MTNRLLVLSGRVCLRLHLWLLAITLFSWVGPLASLDRAYHGRLTYAFLLARQSAKARGIFATMVRRDIDASPGINRRLSAIAWRLGEIGLARLIDTRTRRLAPDSYEAAAAEAEIDFIRSLETDEVSTCIAAALDRFQASLRPDLPVIIVPLSSCHLALFALWKQQLELHATGQLLVLALDGGTVGSDAALGSSGTIDLSGFFTSNEDGRLEDYCRGRLWTTRVAVIRHLLSLGFSVISLDVDAILVGDLDGMLKSLPPADIIAQQDYSIPIEVARKLGFILCCGFMVIRPNAKTRAFADAYLDRTVLELDDQTALNHLLADAGITRLSHRSDHLSFDSMGLTWICPSTALVSRDINYGAVIRHFQQTGQIAAKIREMLFLSE